MSLIINPYFVAPAGGGADFDYTNMLWRVRAADITGKSDNDSLDTVVWLDTSGNSRNWTFHACLYRTNQVNGHPAIQFGGQINDDYVTGIDISALSLSEIDVYLVVQALNDPPGSNSNAGLWQMCPTGSSYYAVSLYPTIAGNIEDGAFTPATSDQRVIGNPTPSLTSWRLYRVVAKSGTNNHQSFVDGTTLATRTDTPSFPTSSRLGKNQDGDGLTFWFQGMQAEFFAFSTKAIGSQYTSIKDYVNSYYGLSVS